MKCPKCGKKMEQPYPTEEPDEYSCPDCELDVSIDWWEEEWSAQSAGAR